MKKGAKRTFILGATFIASVSLNGCGGLYAPPPDFHNNLTPTATESVDSDKKGPVLETVGLEFEIAQRVELSDFAGHDEIPGWFGANEYLGKDYKAIPAAEEGGAASRPEVYVSYIVTSYPDYSDAEKAVTGIIITDPKVTVFGHTVATPAEEFDKTLQEKGFAIEHVGEGTRRKATKGDISVSYGDGVNIRIEAEVTNLAGIIF
ncbi:MAG: hypothetical protein J5532_07970 [Lachnospiraceae bacterium]|nr:hypothetical protein [Lachnospiraceae bacterium]